MNIKTNFRYLMASYVIMTNTIAIFVYIGPRQIVLECDILSLLCYFVITLIGGKFYEF